MNNGVLFVAPVLPIDVAVSATALCEHGWLDRLVTRTTLQPAYASKLARVPLLRAFSRRPSSPVPREFLVEDRMADFIASLSYALSRSHITSTDASFRHVDRCASKLVHAGTRAVLAREDACLETFRAARQRDVPTIYQLPTAFCSTVEKILEREHALFPGVAAADEESNAFRPDRQERKHAELAAASVVFCPSTFVASSLPPEAVANKQVLTLPFGVEQSWLRRGAAKRDNMFLYTGRISLRKGVHRLLTAWKKLAAHRTHKLLLVGEMALNEKFLRDFHGMFEHVPRVARSELPRYYERAQAFLFNTPADGFGNVILEAMACSTPVLASRNSGAPDVITDGADGKLFDFGDDEQFVAALDWALSRPDELREMGECAHERSARSTWKCYGNSLLTFLKSVVEECSTQTSLGASKGAVAYRES